MNTSTRRLLPVNSFGTWIGRFYGDQGSVVSKNSASMPVISPGEGVSAMPQVTRPEATIPTVSLWPDLRQP